jgi:hypothetical protein
MKPIEFPESNFTLTAPQGLENCGDLPCQKSDGRIISCWQISDEELKKLNETKYLYLGVLSPDTHPPCFITVDYPFIKLNIGDTIAAPKGYYRIAILKDNGFLHGEEILMDGGAVGKIIMFDDKYTMSVIDTGPLKVIIPNDKVKDKLKI